MGLNMKGLKKVQKDIKDKAGDGDGLFLYSSKLKEEDDIRILPPLPNLNGYYFVEVIEWWINGKTFLSLETFDEDCPITAMVDEAKESGDKEVLALINAKKDGRPVLKKSTSYLIPILHLDCQFDEDSGDLLDWNVQGVKVLKAKPTLMKNINAVVTSRNFQNDTEDKIADRVKGWNITVGKTGKGLNTEYTAIGWNEPMEMDEKYYTDKAIPDVVKLRQDMKKEPDYLESVIGNYLYGDDIIEDVHAKGSDKEDDSPKKATRRSRKKDEETKATSTRSSRSRAKKEEKEEKPVRGRSGRGGRKLNEDAAEFSSDDDDMNDLD